MIIKIYSSPIIIIFLLLYTAHTTANSSLSTTEKKALIKRMIELNYNAAAIASTTGLPDEKAQNLLQIIKAENEDILTDINYQRIGGLRFNTDRVTQALEDKCSHCSNKNLGSFIRYSSNEQYSNFYNQIQQKHTRCSRNLIKSIGENLIAERIPKQCTQKKYQNNKDCKTIFADFEIVEKRITDILTLMSERTAISQTEADAFCVLCKDDNLSFRGFFNMRAFNRIIEKSGEHLQCDSLEIGDRREVHTDTNIGSSYHLIRDNDGVYSIPLYISFSASRDYDGPVPRDQVNSYYLNKAQECINQANEKFTGPKGKKLKIAIQPSPETECRRRFSSIHNILIGSANLRSHSKQYTSDISCATITHEVLHLLGLCDEYRERTVGYYIDPNTGEVFSGKDYKEDAIAKLAYDCRVVHNYSIMSNHKTIWHDKIIQKEEGSLLTPGQFQAILYGNCKQNQFFNECSQLAYKNSVTHGKACLKKRRQCAEQNGLGQSKEIRIKELETELAVENRQLINTRKRLEYYQQAITEDENNRSIYSGGRKLTGEERVQHLRNEISEENERIKSHSEEIKSLEEFLQKVRAWPDQNF